MPRFASGVLKQGKTRVHENIWGKPDGHGRILVSYLWYVYDVPRQRSCDSTDSRAASVILRPRSLCGTLKHKWKPVLAFIEKCPSAPSVKLWLQLGASARFIIEDVVRDELAHFAIESRIESVKAKLALDVAIAQLTWESEAILKQRDPKTAHGLHEDIGY